MSLNDASANSVTKSPAGEVVHDGTGMVFFYLVTKTQFADSCRVGIVQLDPYLDPYKEALRSRYAKAQKWLKTLDETEGGMEKFTRVRNSGFAVGRSHV